VRERVLAERRQRRGTHIRWAAVAIAASLVAIIGTRTYDRNRLEAEQSAKLAEIMSRNQALEARLSEIDPDGRVVSGFTAGAVSEMQDRIANIDAEIGQPVQTAGGERLLNLMRDRVELMQGLVNVHVTRHAYLGM
jgi:hypothetical protein